MKTVIIVSKCLRVIRANKAETHYQFHFKGVCAGELLKTVLLRARNDFGIEKGEEYLMYVHLIDFRDGTLKGEILKLKKLEDCWDRT